MVLSFGEHFKCWLLMTHIYYDICKSLRASFTKLRQPRPLFQGIYCTGAKPWQMRMTAAQSPLSSPSRLFQLPSPSSRLGGLVPGDGDGAAHTAPATPAPAEGMDDFVGGKTFFFNLAFRGSHTAAPCTRFLQLRHKLLLHRPL